MRDGGAYGCAVPRAYANLNPGLQTYTKLQGLTGKFPGVPLGESATAKKNEERLSIWRPFAILNFRRLIMGSFKSKPNFIVITQSAAET